MDATNEDLQRQESTTGWEETTESNRETQWRTGSRPTSCTAKHLHAWNLQCLISNEEDVAGMRQI